jgi:tetratricopeptide (TPR) repeat protein
MDSPDLALEFQIAVFVGEPIKKDVRFGIEKTPMIFGPFLEQCINKIREFKRIGRLDSCKLIVEEISAPVVEFGTKWSDSISVLKLCGDFECEAAQFLPESDHGVKAVGYYRKRAEIDKRAEAFLDVAHALQVLGRFEDSLTVLRRVIDVFATHAGLWLNLGVAYALTGAFAFARHCLCVSSRLATDSEAARSFACCAAAARLIDDGGLFRDSLSAARRCNPYDSDVWQLLATTDDVSPLDASLIAFEFGASERILPNLAGLLLKRGRYVEALNYGMMVGKGDIKSCCYEGLSRFDEAYRLAVSDCQKSRLSAFVGGSILEGRWERYVDGDYAKAAQEFRKDSTACGDIAAALCLIKNGTIEEGVSLLERVKEYAPFLAIAIDKIMLQIVPVELNIQSSFSHKNPEMMFLEMLRKNTRMEAALHIVQNFPNNPTAIEIYIIEALRSGLNDNISDFLVTKARVLFDLRPGRRSLVLMVVCMVRGRLWREAVGWVQTLCVLMPEMRFCAIPLLNSLRRNLCVIFIYICVNYSLYSYKSNNIFLIKLF